MAAEAAAAEAKAAAARATEAEAAVVRATAERAAAEEEAIVEKAAAVDAELRRKREEAQATLRTRRPRPLSESILDAAVGAVLNASATKEEGGGGDGLGKVASWVAQERERMLVESEAKERYGRLALFEADLELLGVTVDEAVTMDAKQLTPTPYPPTPTLPLTSPPIPNPNPNPNQVDMDEKSLRRAFRDRSRVLHPDVRDQHSAEELAGVPSVYELNAAFEVVKKLLVKT